MRELEELLKKSSFFLNNDAKVSDMTIKIKEVRTAKTNG